MAQVLESTSECLVLRFRSTALTLDKKAATATLQRKILFWSLKPVTKRFSDVVDITVDVAVDRASGVEVYHVMLVMRTGDAWALAENDKKSAQDSIVTTREFLGLKSN